MDQHDPFYTPPGLPIVLALVPPTQSSLLPPKINCNETEPNTPTYKLTGTLPPKTPTNTRAGQYVQLLPPPPGYVKG
jgi:hypothetical protein